MFYGAAVVGYRGLAMINVKYVIGDVDALGSRLCVDLILHGTYLVE